MDSATRKKFEKVVGGSAKTSGTVVDGTEAIQVSNPDLLAALSRLAARQDRLAELPLCYATVLGFRDGHGPKASAFDFGTPVQTVDAKGVARKGTVVSEAESDGKVMVVHADGSVAWFSTTSKPDTQPTIAILPCDNARVVLDLSGRTIEVRRPDGIALSIGMTVALHQTTMQIVSVVGDRGIGDIGTVQRQVDPDNYEVDVRGLPRVVNVAIEADALQRGASVLLDTSLSCIIGVVPDRNPLEYRTTKPVQWGDIGGHDATIAELREVFFDSGDTLEGFYPLQEPRGAVLSGPPGCGKTLIVRALITELMERRSATGAPFTHLYLKGPELLASLVGKAEAALRSIHAACRKVHAEHGFWPVIIWDECDALFKVRGSGISSDATDGIVNTQLAETDGVEGGSAPNFYLTNRVDLVDPALYREGRVDLILEVGRPDAAGVEQIFAIHLKDRPIGKETTVADLARAAAGLLCDPRFSIYSMKVGEQGKEREEFFTLAHIVSGAMVKDVVQKAERLARREDRKNTSKVGILFRHLETAITAKFQERLRFDHVDDLKRHSEKLNERVSGVVKLRQMQQ